MTTPTKPLDIEARELLARQLEVGLYHDDAERIKVAQDGLGVICAASAIAAISELLTRLREVEPAAQVTHEECKTEIQRLEHELSTSQALLEECLGRANDVSALKEIVREHFYAGPLDGCTERLATVLSRHIQGLPLRTPEEEEALRVSNLNAEDRKAYWIERNRAASLIEKLEGMG